MLVAQGRMDMGKMEKHFAVRCQCGHPSCTAWHVTPCAAVQCVRFTEKQARAVARLLNEMEEEGDDRDD